VHVFAQKAVVEEVEDERVDISLKEARRIKPDAQLGDILEFEVTLANAGRIAAQTAKQVVLQRLREAEREMSTRSSPTARRHRLRYHSAVGRPPDHRRPGQDRGRPAA